MTLSDVVFAVVGVGALLAALLPRLLAGRRPVSMPIVFLGLGTLLGLVPGLPTLDPIQEGGFVEHLAEVTVIVALMGAGLALDRPPSWRGWQGTWRLLAIGMPLTIGAVAVLGTGVLGLALAPALLLGAALAPTDPVLAGEVQVGEPALEPPQDGEPEQAEDEVRFGLTSEAGLNDALAFPFVYLAILVAERGSDPSAWLAEWLLVDVVYKLVVGVLGGYLVGKALGRLFFSTRRQVLRLAEHSEGFVALAATFLAYGVTEVAQGYGFLAVFVAAVTIRGSERFHGYHRVLHDFTEQVERLLTVLVLLLVGIALTDGLLAGVGLTELLVAAVVLLVVRPLAAGVALIGSCGTLRERATIAFFGVRGIGSVYYVAYGLGAAAFTGSSTVWSVVALVIVGSVLLHGTLAGPVMGRLDARAGAEPEPDADTAQPVTQ